MELSINFLAIIGAFFIGALFIELCRRETVKKLKDRETQIEVKEGMIVTRLQNAWDSGESRARALERTIDEKTKEYESLVKVNNEINKAKNEYMMLVDTKKREFNESLSNVMSERDRYKKRVEEFMMLEVELKAKIMALESQLKG